MGVKRAREDKYHAAQSGKLGEIAIVTHKRQGYVSLVHAVETDSCCTGEHHICAR